MDNLIKRASRQLVEAGYAIALTGAGISTESGIRDFRGPSGVWTLNPEAERRASRGYQDFMADPRGWWQSAISRAGDDFVGDISAARPNSGHRALAEMEEMGILKCTITQNIDGLHEQAGTQHLLEYHGSVNKLRCLSCGARYNRQDFDLDMLLAQDALPPRCPACHGVLKTDTVFFGEPIPSDVAEQSLEEALRCDLMLVCGTSAVVYPFAALPRAAREYAGATIIEINAEPTPLTDEGVSDYLIRGKTGEVLPSLLAKIRDMNGG